MRIDGGTDAEAAEELLAGVPEPSCLECRASLLVLGLSAEQAAVHRTMRVTALGLRGRGWNIWSTLIRPLRKLLVRTSGEGSCLVRAALATQ